MFPLASFPLPDRRAAVRTAEGRRRPPLDPLSLLLGERKKRIRTAEEESVPTHRESVERARFLLKEIDAHTVPHWAARPSSLLRSLSPSLSLSAGLSAPSPPVYTHERAQQREEESSRESALSLSLSTRSLCAADCLWAMQLRVPDASLALFLSPARLRRCAALRDEISLRESLSHGSVLCGERLRERGVSVGDGVWCVSDAERGRAKKRQREEDERDEALCERALLCVERKRLHTHTRTQILSAQTHMECEEALCASDTVYKSTDAVSLSLGPTDTVFSLPTQTQTHAHTLSAHTVLRGRDSETLRGIPLFLFEAHTDKGTHIPSCDERETETLAESVFLLRELALSACGRECVSAPSASVESRYEAEEIDDLSSLQYTHSHRHTQTRTDRKQRGSALRITQRVVSHASLRALALVSPHSVLSHHALQHAASRVVEMDATRRFHIIPLRVFANNERALCERRPGRESLTRRWQRLCERTVRTPAAAPLSSLLLREHCVQSLRVYGDVRAIVNVGERLCAEDSLGAFEMLCGTASLLRELEATPPAREIATDIQTQAQQQTYTEIQENPQIHTEKRPVVDSSITHTHMESRIETHTHPETPRESKKESYAEVLSERERYSQSLTALTQRQQTGIEEKKHSAAVSPSPPRAQAVRGPMDRYLARSVLDHTRDVVQQRSRVPHTQSLPHMESLSSLAAAKATAKTATMHKPLATVRLSGVKVLVSETFFEERALVVAALLAQHELILRDSYIHDRVDVIVSPDVGVVLVSQRELQATESTARTLKAIMNASLKFARLWILVLREDAKQSENGSEKEDDESAAGNWDFAMAAVKLAQAFSRCPCAVMIRDVRASEHKLVAHCIARICESELALESATRAAEGTGLSLSRKTSEKILSEKAFLDLLQDRTFLAHCDFLQRFPTMNLYMCAMLLSLYSLREIASQSAAAIVSRVKWTFSTSDRTDQRIASFMQIFTSLK